MDVTGATEGGATDIGVEAEDDPTEDEDLWWRDDRSDEDLVDGIADSNDVELGVECWLTQG